MERQEAYLQFKVSLLLSLLVASVSGFIPAWRLPPQLLQGTVPCWGTFGSSPDSEKSIVDADFERVLSEDETTDTEKNFPSAESFETLGDESKKKTLFDLSLDADPRWKEARIPFCRGDEYIDAKLAFMVQLEGIQYGIGVPYDDAVAIIVQDTTGSTGSSREGNDKGSVVTYVDPDLYDENEEYQELMEIMAVQVQNELGEELALRKTPKVLTISGGLSRITDTWERDLLGEPMRAEEMLKASSLTEETNDREIAEFLDFMKAELGEEEFEKTMREDPSEEDRELVKYFKVPGLGTKMDDISELEELIKSMANDLDEDDGVTARAKEFEPNTKGLALKLVAFDFANGKKSYSLVKLLQPYVLVGKYHDEQETNADEDNEVPEKDFRFELLSREEERVLIPKLEDVCGKTMAQAGLSFDGNEHNVKIPQ